MREQEWRCSACSNLEAVECPNCDALGYARPTTLVIDGPRSDIVIQGRGDPAPAGAMNAIGAGPNLVSYDETIGAYVNIPADDHNVNIVEHAANTAVGLRRIVGPDGESIVTGLVLVTADGRDGCPETDATCGIDAYRMAYFMRDALNVTVAMEMDQGGSTTMFVRGEGVDGVVSCSGGCGSGPRAVFDGLFVGLE